MAFSDKLLKAILFAYVLVTPALADDSQCSASDPQCRDANVLMQSTMAVREHVNAASEPEDISAEEQQEADETETEAEFSTEGRDEEEGQEGPDEEAAIQEDEEEEVSSSRAIPSEYSRDGTSSKLKPGWKQEVDPATGIKYLVDDDGIRINEIRVNHGPTGVRLGEFLYPITPSYEGCCSWKCSSDSDCADPHLFCCPRTKVCQDRCTKSGYGRFCQACNAGKLPIPMGSLCPSQLRDLCRPPVGEGFGNSKEYGYPNGKPTCEEECVFGTDPLKGFTNGGSKWGVTEKTVDFAPKAQACVNECTPQCVQGTPLINGKWLDVDDYTVDKCTEACQKQICNWPQKGWWVVKKSKYEACKKPCFSDCFKNLKKYGIDAAAVDPAAGKPAKPFPKKNKAFTTAPPTAAPAAGKCKGYCGTVPEVWTVKCKWAPCKGCQQCSGNPAPAKPKAPAKKCKDFCKWQPQEWATKCKWDNCNGCQQCP